MSRTSSYFHTFRLPVDRRDLFELFADPRYLDRLTPPWFRLLPEGDVSQSLRVGSEISYWLRWRGFRLRWTSLLTDWRAPDYFAYEQKQGPYRFFRHEHFFQDVDGETEVTDRVFFRTPAGALADRLIVRPDLRRIFAFRERHALPVLLALRPASEAEANPQ